MSNDETRRYGLIGAGVVGQAYIRALALVEGADLAAIAEPDAEPMNWTFKTLKTSRFSPAIYSDWQEMLAAMQIDAVIVSTARFSQSEILTELMQTDIAILVEPPICNSLKDAVQIARLDEKRAALMQAGLAYRYMPPVARFIQRLHAGEVGPPRMMAIREYGFEFLRTPDARTRLGQDRGGTLVSAGCHVFDLMRLALQDEPVQIYASAGLNVLSSGKGSDVFDNAFVVVDFANGARAQLDLCLFADGAEQYQDICVTGEMGRLEVQIPAGVVTFSPRAQSGVQHEPVSVGEEVLAVGGYHGAVVYQLRDFHQALVNATPAPVSMSEVVRSIEMGLAAQQSAATGKVVALSR